MKKYESLKGSLRAKWTDPHLINLKQPVLLIHEVSYRNSELCLCIWTVQYFYHQQILIHNLKPSPHFLHWFCINKHRVLLVESFIRVQPHLIDHDQPFLPPTQNLRLLEDLSVNPTVLYYRLRHSRNALLQWAKLMTHQLQLAAYYRCEHNVMQRQFLLFEPHQFLRDRHHQFIRIVANF